MSNKTQLSTNNDKLASLIQELANKAAGGGGGVNLDVCSFKASVNEIGYGVYTYIRCAWTEFYDGICEPIVDESISGISVEGYPICNSVVTVMWRIENNNRYTPSIEVEGAEIVHQTENTAIIIMPAEAGSHVDITVTYA